MKKNGKSNGAPAPEARAKLPVSTLPVRLKAEDAAVARGLGSQYESAVHALGGFHIKRKTVLARLDAEESALWAAVVDGAKKMDGEVASLRARYHIQGDGWHFDYGAGQFTRPDKPTPDAPPAPAAPPAPDSKETAPAP